MGDEVVKQINVEQLDWEPPAGLNVNSEVTVRTGAGMTAHGASPSCASLRVQLLTCGSCVWSVVLADLGD